MKCLCYDQFSWLDLTLTLGEQYATIIREASLLKGTFHERRDGASSRGEGFTPSRFMEIITRPDCTLDLGEKGCSHLLQDITDAMKDMAPGQTLLVIARDPAAPLDIKVWSSQTNNPLLRADLSNNHFLLQKKFP